ncbi:hypothetical protein [Desulfarculus baarsii]
MGKAALVCFAAMLSSCGCAVSAPRSGREAGPFLRGGEAAQAAQWLPLAVVIFVAGVALGVALVVWVRRWRLRRALRAGQGRAPAGELQNLQLSLMLLEKAAQGIRSRPAEKDRAAAAPPRLKIL